MQKVYFSRLMRVCVGLIMLVAGTYSKFPFFSWSAGLGRFLQVSALASHCWRIVQNLRQRRGKRTESTTPSAIQASSQSTSLLSMNNYTPLVISRNYKNKQLILLCQGKLALTAVNKLLQYKIIGAPNKFQNLPRPLVRTSFVNFVKILLICFMRQSL